jgi:hypothetical protein
MFGLLVLVGLFIALTPGVLFRLKGSKMGSAAMHAVLFGVVVYLVSMYGPSYGISYEGFLAGTEPICPPESTYTRGLCRAQMICPRGTTKVDHQETIICIDPKRKSSKPTCPKGTVLSNNICRPIVVGKCPPELNGPEDGECMASPNCSGASHLVEGRCIPLEQTISNPEEAAPMAQPIPTVGLIPNPLGGM